MTRVYISNPLCVRDIITSDKNRANSYVTVNQQKNETKTH